MANTHKRIDYIIDEVKATQAMEGLLVTKEEEELARTYLSGKISRKEYFDILISQAKKIAKANG
jgi:hypothetical protein